MKAITLKDYRNDPYGTWVEQGIKDIETRKWKPADYQNGMEWDLLICVSKSSYSPNRGLAVAVVTLYHIEEMVKEHEERAKCEVYARNKNGDPAYAWFLKNRRLLSKKFPVNGRLGIFEVPFPKKIELIHAPNVYDTEIVAIVKQGLLF